MFVFQPFFVARGIHLSLLQTILILIVSHISTQYLKLQHRINLFDSMIARSFSFSLSSHPPSSFFSFEIRA